MGKIPPPARGLTPERPLPDDCAKRFGVVRHLADGGFGAVFLAEDGHLGRPVAIKLLLAETLEDRDQVLRFIDEARITASVSHPGVIQVVDFGAEHGVPWIAYEYVAGRSLREILDGGPMAPADAIDAAIQVAAALGAAHARGVLHRDIKPENVLEVAPGRFKVTDFGIAKWAGEGAVKTRTGVILGTPAYVSPEQIAGEPASQASDIYALGVMLFELATGERPFHGDNPAALMERHLKSPIPRPSALRPDLPRSLDAVMIRALAKSPRDRYASATAMAQDLERIRSAVADWVPAVTNERSAARASPRTTVAIGQAAFRTAVRSNTVAATSAPARPSGVRFAAWAMAVTSLLAVALLATRRSVSPVSPPSPPPSVRPSPSAVHWSALAADVNALALEVLDLKNRVERSLGDWRTWWREWKERHPIDVEVDSIREDFLQQAKCVDIEHRGTLPDGDALAKTYLALVSRLTACGNQVLATRVPWFVERVMVADCSRLVDLGFVLYRSPANPASRLVDDWARRHSDRMGVHELLSHRHRQAGRLEKARREWEGVVRRMDLDLRDRLRTGRAVTDLFATGRMYVLDAYPRGKTGIDRYLCKDDDISELTVLVDVYSELYRKYHEDRALREIEGRFELFWKVWSMLGPEQQRFYLQRPQVPQTPGLIRWLDELRRRAARACEASGRGTAPRE